MDVEETADLDALATARLYQIGRGYAEITKAIMTLIKDAPSEIVLSIDPSRQETVPPVFS